MTTFEEKAMPWAKRGWLSLVVVCSLVGLLGASPMVVEVSGPDSLMARLMAAVVLAALIVGGWRIGQAIAEITSSLAALVIVWFRNRWGC